MSMRNCACFLTIIAAASLAICSLAVTSAAAPAVTLKVLNPRGEIAPPPVFAPRPRISDLSGKKIGIYWNGKAGGNYFWNIIEQLLKEKLPGTTVVRYNGAYDIGDPLAAKVSGEVDAFFYGVGD
jgi:hypothetical protein